MTEETNALDLLGLTTEIVAAYVSNNSLQPSEIPALIEQTHRTLAHLGGGEPVSSEPPQPAVPIKKSVHEDYIICLEDGRKLKMLRRHLKTAYGMTPDQYRERWGLSADYPMVAPSYAVQRSRLAKNIGLGRQKGGRGGKKK